MKKSLNPADQSLLKASNLEELNITMTQRIALVRKLVTQKKANLGAKGKYGLTPLHYASGVLASRPNNLSLVKALIELGADVNALTKSGTATIGMALQAVQWAIDERYSATKIKEREQVVRLLAQHGSLLDKKSKAWYEKLYKKILRSK